MAAPTIPLTGQATLPVGGGDPVQPFKVKLQPARAILADDGTILVPAEAITITLDGDTIPDGVTIVPSDADATDTVPYFVQELFGDYRSGYVSPLTADGTFNLFAQDYDGYVAPDLPTVLATGAALAQETADREAADQTLTDQATTLAAGLAAEITNRQTAITAEVTRADAAYDPAGTAQTKVDTLVGGAPGLLDTLKELADAINDDANFAATVVTALAAKATPADITAAVNALALLVQPVLTAPQTVTYNPDGTVATVTIAGAVTAYTYNPDGTVATETRGATTRTYTYVSSRLTEVA